MFYQRSLEEILEAKFDLHEATFAARGPLVRSDTSAGINPMMEVLRDPFSATCEALDDQTYGSDANCIANDADVSLAAAEVIPSPSTAVGPAISCWKLNLQRCPVPASLPKLNLKKGTTTLGFRFNGGICLAVDSRASSGQYIASQTVQKVLEINEMLLGTMAGGAADCQYWERVLGMECRLWELRNNVKITVAAASKILAGITYAYRNQGLSMGTMVAGWDKYGPSLYYVDDQGTRMKNDVFSVGSGSIYAYGVLDSGYRADMSVDEATDLARRAIFHATFRDGGSGGYVSVYHVHQNGWTKISRDDQTLLYERYMAHAKAQ